ncbi:type I restriction endonuclease subunit R [Vreelandella jeotgali]|uniref:type I restriction endonuclease subunit R n=1 Tax=Vreelandella jeotgali TaxID=553386 RepID=UPI00034BA20F|nr:DEAD/DEAH box helicase family protein [Halomonas jeotgali]
MNGDTAHREKHFENYIVSQLEQQGWKVGTTSEYDTETALYPADLMAWLKATQPDKWDKLCEDYPDSPQGALMSRLAQHLDQKNTSTVQTLRRGFKIAGCGHIDLSEAAPEDKRNEDVLHRYEANILRVVPQLQYHPPRNLAIDLVFFINGLPVATVEVKTDFTQSADAAVQQYKEDRLPQDPKTKRVEPLLTFQRGAVVHFAVSESDIQMTTKLDGANTTFLPFNQGNDGHAGNPARDDGEYPVAYFWEQVCQRDAWLRVFHSFVYLEKKDVVDLKGNWKKKETLIFPRFHQWDAVNKMIADADVNGAGMNYLCEHSAGSGKTSTIAWTAHDLVKLRHDDGTPKFNSVVIVTDRTVLDSQLQDAVKQIDHQSGMIAAIDRSKGSESKSKKLAKALTQGTPIVVVTLQTFPYAMEAMVTDDRLKDSRFAVIIDEAHNSQTGTDAAKLQAALSLSSQDDMANMDVEQLLERLQQARHRPDNISYFAFTATPKHSTMMLFGRTQDGRRASDDNLPVSFHRYPMRQAIEEGFILDVLTGYTPYETAVNLSTQLLDSKRVGNKAARRALAQWIDLHPTIIAQKVQFIIEHFSRNVAHRLDGKAKAMVVTSSRAAAVRYKMHFDKYIEGHSEHRHIHSLVAISGKLTGRQLQHAEDDGSLAIDADAEFNENNLNPAVAGQDLRNAFERPEYRVMLVADKFQTGFDQPKLVAMYVDKKIANDVEIVQTLSRLNRTAPGKDETFVIDFVNEPESVRAAFAKYDDGAEIEQVQDLNVVYDIAKQLDDHDLYDESDLDAFKQARFKTLRDITSASEPQHKAMYAATERPTRLFNEQLKMLRDAVATWEDAYEKAHHSGDDAGMKSADHQRNEYAEQVANLMTFKKGLSRFGRTYAYVAQLIDFGDPELENFAAFAKLLAKRLDDVPPETIDLSGLVLTGFDIKDKEDAGEDDDEAPVLQPGGAGGGGRADKANYLQEIIDRLNRIFGEATPIKDRATFVNQIAGISRENDVVMAQVENNTREQALKGNLSSTVQQGVVRALNSHQDLATQLLKSDTQAMTALTNLVYDLLAKGEDIDLDDRDA